MEAPQQQTQRVSQLVLPRSFVVECGTGTCKAWCLPHRKPGMPCGWQCTKQTLWCRSGMGPSRHRHWSCHLGPISAISMFRFHETYIVVTKTRWWSSLARLSSPSVVLLLSSGSVRLSQVQVVWNNWLERFGGGLSASVGAAQSAQWSLQSEIDCAIASNVGDALDRYGLIRDCIPVQWQRLDRNWRFSRVLVLLIERHKTAKELSTHTFGIEWTWARDVGIAEASVSLCRSGTVITSLVGVGTATPSTGV